MNTKKIVALVPMRHHSQRVPGKNYRELAGKPLFHYILGALQESALFEQIVVDTDSPTILEDLARNFPEIMSVSRPEELCGDAISMNEILLHDTGLAPADLYLQTHSTNPFLGTATISQAVNTFLEKSPPYDSLFSVTRISTRLWDRDTKPINHDPDVLLQTQDLPPIYEENSCLYIFSAEKLRARRNRIGETPLMFEMSPDEALDIDDESDFLIADLLMQHRLRSKLV